jgi:hypothetical protein
MNPFDLDATGLMVWGLVAHLIADWIFQNDWMAVNKVKRWPILRDRPVNAMGERVERYWEFWWLRHPAAFVHAGIHGIALALVFSWVAAPLALAHLIIDTRAPVAWLSKLIRQTQPSGKQVMAWDADRGDPKALVVVDVGMFVRFWVDQVWHVACIAIAALAVTA